MGKTQFQLDATQVIATRRRFSFGTRLALFGVLLTTLSVSLCAFFAYRLRIDALKTSIAAELLAVVNSTAGVIDGDQHNRIQGNQNNDIRPLEDFQEIRAILLEVKRRNRLTGHGSPIYTMRKAPDYATSGQLEFVVMTDPDDHGKFFVGARYPALPHLNWALQGRPATTGLYSDSEGTWISAAAPILDHRGQVVGLIQADRPVNHLKSEARRSALWIMSSALASAIFGWILTWFYSRSLVGPIVELAQAARDIGKGALDVQVHSHRDDELGDLATAFNRMALRLSEARSKDEAQIRTMEAARLEIEVSNLELAKANSDLESAFQEARQLAVEAEAASRAKSEFLSIMSHELRTPLNGVLGLAQVLEHSNLDAEALDSVHIIRASGEKLLKTITDVLLYTQLESGKAAVYNQPFKPSEIIQGLGQTFGPRCVEKRLHLQFKIDAISRGMVVGDGEKFQMVLEHLLDNAVKFTPEGNVEVSVKTEVLPARSGAAATRLVHVCIDDTGVGIPPTMVSRLFQPFSQLDSSSSRSFEGLGLGLALSSRLVARLGGKLKYEPNPAGKGARFLFSACFSEPTPSSPPAALGMGGERSPDSPAENGPKLREF